jgi:hypothetical protein
VAKISGFGRPDLLAAHSAMGHGGTALLFFLISFLSSLSFSSQKHGQGVPSHWLLLRLLLLLLLLLLLQLLEVTVGAYTID